MLVFRNSVMIDVWRLCRVSAMAHDYLCLHEQVVRHVAVKRINECRTYSDWVQDSASFTLEVGGSDPRGRQLLTVSAVVGAVLP